MVIAAVRPSLLSYRLPRSFGLSDRKEANTPQEKLSLSGVLDGGDHDPGHLEGRLRVNGVEGARVHPGEPALLEMDFIDPDTGQRLVEFELEHEKLMHTLIVSEDLESFAHIHPELTCDGVFRAGINQPTADPDSRDAVNAVNKSGNFMIFSEVKPVDRPVQAVRFGLEATGNAAVTPLTPDRVGPSGSIRKYFSADGKEADPGAHYQVTLSVEHHHGDSPMVHLNVNLQSLHQGGHYADVSNVDNWLGMPGHAVLIGSQGNLEEKEFRHLHAGGHGDHAAEVQRSPSFLVMDEGGHPPHDPPGQGSGPDFTFMVNDVPPSGIYKLWAQFKHEGEVRTFPFVFQLTDQG